MREFYLSSIFLAPADFDRKMNEINLSIKNKWIYATHCLRLLANRKFFLFEAARRWICTEYLYSFHQKKGANGP